jgi:hypothetical protein
VLITGANRGLGRAQVLESGESPGLTVYYVLSMSTLVVGDILTPGCVSPVGPPVNRRARGADAR